MFTIVKYTLFNFVNMKNQLLKNLFQDEYYSEIKFEKVTGRYITNTDLKFFLKHLNEKFEITQIGRSVDGKPISMIKLGTGKTKILVWSQMHGNEGTTTKAVFDLLNAFKQNDNDVVLSGILRDSTLYIIPILNPDGADAYTRVNANEIDLNRDMQKLSQPESKVLMQQYKAIDPDFCLNLHDQRTIFSVGENPCPATLSFLTPSRDEERSVDESRKKSMSVIAGIAEDLSKDLSGHIGRYDDAFNINCAGDCFQNLNTPTILFEAGHYPEDYSREITRKYVFQALISCLYQISASKIATSYDRYFDIPENQKLFNDLIVRNVKIEGNAKDLAIQFKEVLKSKKIEFEPFIEKIQDEIRKFGHQEIQGKGNEIRLPYGAKFFENVIVNKIIINDTELEVKRD